MRLVVPFGFYGCGNIGDEATLNGFASLVARLSPSTHVSICSRNPSHTAQTEPTFRYFGSSGIDVRRWLAKITASAHVFAGGTPVQDVLGDWPLCEVAPLVQASDQQGVPLTFVGVGVEGLRHDRSRKILAERIVPRVRHWSVRSARDRERLLSWGVSSEAVTVAADMAWLIDPVSDGFGTNLLARLGVGRQQLLIAVNLVNENHIFDKQPELVAAFATGLDVLIEKTDARVVFVAQEVRDEPTFDTASALRVKACMARGDRAIVVPTEYFSPRQLMSIIGCCDLSISMRYHFCLLTSLQGKPFIAIQRTDKLADLCWDLGWDAATRPADTTADSLIEHGLQLLTDGTVSQGQLKRRVEGMRERALNNLVALEALRGNGIGHAGAAGRAS
jgi:polysaccharide pyruvyl transferase WcaK-like protein